MKLLAVEKNFKYDCLDNVPEQRALTKEEESEKENRNTEFGKHKK